VSDEQLEQLGGGGGHLIDGALEDRFVGFRRMGEAAELAHELHGRGVDFVLTGWRREIMERLDVPAHGAEVSDVGG
jgi:hypothetical protein